MVLERYLHARWPEDAGGGLAMDLRSSAAVSSDEGKAVRISRSFVEGSS